MPAKPEWSGDRGRIVVITVSRDDYTGLRDTLESAKAQTNQDFRHLVIDSSKNPSDVEQMVSEYRAEYHWTPPSGIYPAMKLGLEKLKDSDHCWFLNSSDTFADASSVDIVSRRLFAEGGGELTWALGKVLLIGKNGSKIYSATNGSADLLATARKGRIYFPHSSTIIKVSKLRAVDPFAENLRIAQDYLIALKILTRFGPPEILEDVLSNFALGGITSQQTVRTGLETVRARLLVFGISQMPREMWNVIRVIGGRPLKKMYSTISLKLSSRDIS